MKSCLIISLIAAITSTSLAALPITDGLVLHLDAGSIEGVEDESRLSTWTDLSGKGNHATQSSSDDCPQYIAACSSFDDQPGVHFDGSSWMKLNSTMINVGSFTMFAVGQFNASSGNQYMVAGQDGGGNDRIRFALDTSRDPDVFEYRAGSSGWRKIISPSDTDIHTFAITSKVEGFLDGTSVGTNSNSSTENPTAFNIGSYNRGQKDFYVGNLAILVLYNRVLTDDEIAILSTYLMNEAITGPYPTVKQSGKVVPTDLGYQGLPWPGDFDWDIDQDPPLGIEDGNSVKGNGAFYSDVQGTGSSREYTAFRIYINTLMDHTVQIGEIDTISYYTNMFSTGTSDWHLEIVTENHLFDFQPDNTPDDGWDLWSLSDYPLASIDGVTDTNYFEDVSVNYVLENIEYIDIVAGDDTTGPEVYSYLDAVTITLINESEVILDLEMQRIPDCSTHAAIDITTTSATLAGAVVDEAGVPAPEYRFLYTPEGGTTLSTAWETAAGNHAKFVPVENLLDGTTYSYQMEICNGADSDLGDLRSFTTLIAPQVEISSSDGGTVTDPGEGVCKVESQGDILDVNAVAEDGYVFCHWTGTAVTEGLVADPMSAVTTIEVYESLTLTAQFKSIKVIWVTEDEDANEDGVRDDVAWVNLLEADGYWVEVQPDRYLTLGDEQDVNDANDYLAELNSAALVIISRSTGSGNYDDDANEIAAWNSITAPVICLSAYLPRSNRWDWVLTTDSLSDNTYSFMSVDIPDHPIFADVNLADGLVDMVDLLIYGEDYQGTTFLDTESMGNATVLGSHLYGYPWIAEWSAGTEYYTGSSQTPAGPRMMFMAGTQETRPTYPQGDLNLTDAGVQVFLNAVDYMFNTVLPISDGLVLHLDAGTIQGVADGNALSVWDDLSGTGNDANQLSVDNQPLYVSASDAFNGQPAVRFNGESSWMELNSDMINVGSFTMLAVAQYSDTSSTQYIVAGQDGSGNDRIRFALDAASDPVFEYRAGNSGWKKVTEMADTEVHSFAITSTVEGFLDGVSLGTAENTSSENPTAFNIGSYNRGEKDFFDGDIAILVIFDRVLSEEEIAKMSDYLMNEALYE